MNPNLKANERELVKAVNQFKKRAENLIRSGKLSEEHKNVLQACDNLHNQINLHADSRAAIHKQHENLKATVKDNAQCPRCHSNMFLKLRGTEANEKGWKSNKYRCRRCNIEFVWNRPNNPWDMLKFMEEFISELDKNIENAQLEENLKQESLQMKNHMQQSLDKLRPVIDASDTDMREMEQKDKEMEKMIHEFKNYLLIEKIKMDTWENREGKAPQASPDPPAETSPDQSAGSRNE